MNKVRKSILTGTSLLLFFLFFVPITFAEETIHVESTEWVDADTFRIHYSGNVDAPGQIGLIYVNSDGSFHAGAYGWLSSTASGYVDFGADLPGQDMSSLSWEAEQGYTRWYKLANSGTSDQFRLVAYNAITPTPSTETKITVSPTTGDKTMGQPFSLNVLVNSPDNAFNAVRSTVAVSSNLKINSIATPTTNACNLQYTQTPKKADPSFAGAIYSGSSTNCTVYTMVLTPTAAGTGTISFSNGSVKAYTDNSEILTGVDNASFTITNGPTPTQATVLQFTVTSPLKTYKTNYLLTGTKLSSITAMYVNSQSISSEHLTENTWEQPVTLTNAYEVYPFVIYGSDGTNQTATKSITVTRHTLGDINGDQVVDLIDASLFAVDWDKTTSFTYVLSNMNDDTIVDLTDLSMLAKLQ